MSKIIDRRDILKMASAGAAALAVSKAAEKAAAAGTVLNGKRYAMAIDLRRCYGCHACSVSCKAEFDVPLGRWRSWVKVMEKGKYPNARRHFLPRLCNHCENPACVNACPVKAAYKNKNGATLQRVDRCLGCRYCMQVCPYNSRFILPRETTAVPYKNIIDKCDFCARRVEKGVEPACVNACPAKARTFGDLNDPDSEIAKLISKEIVSVLKPEMGTKPKVFYINLDPKMVGGQTSGYNAGAPETPEEFISTAKPGGG